MPTHATTHPTFGRLRGQLAAMALLAASATGALAGCGTTSSAAASPPASHTSSMTMGARGSTASMSGMIMISHYRYTTPRSVKPGATVVVMNTDSVTHTVTADSGHAFDVTVPAGSSATFKAPAKRGAYPFHCSYHSTMQSVLHVG